jgi:hypothetical protein
MRGNQCILTHKCSLHTSRNFNWLTRTIAERFGDRRWKSGKSITALATRSAIAAGSPRLTPAAANSLSFTGTTAPICPGCASWLRADPPGGSLQPLQTSGVIAVTVPALATFQSQLSSVFLSSAIPGTRVSYVGIFVGLHVKLFGDTRSGPHRSLG